MGSFPPGVLRLGSLTCQIGTTMATQKTPICTRSIRTEATRSKSRTGTRKIWIPTGSPSSGPTGKPGKTGPVQGAQVFLTPALTINQTILGR